MRKMKTSLYALTLVAIVASIVIAPASVHAATITGVSSDFTTDPATITIDGLNFLDSPAVFLVVNSFINSLTVTLSSPSTIEAELPPDISSGNYLVAVNDGSGLSFFDAQIGALSADSFYNKTCVNVGQCSCDSGDRVVGGGGLCVLPGAIFNSAPNDDATWSVDCIGGPAQDPLQMTIVCARQ